MASRGPYRTLLADNPDFRKLWGAQLISLGGDWFNSVAFLGLVLDLTHSAFYASIVMTATLMPQFLASPFAGVVADRFNRKHLMIGADVASAALALGMLFVRSEETVWIGILFMCAIAVFAAFFQPASQASVPNLVNPGQLSAANVLTGSSWGTMLVIGSALGGLVASALGRDVAFMVNAASFLISALLIVRIKGDFSERSAMTPRAHPIRDIHEGLLYARRDPPTLALILTKSGYGFGAGLLALLPVFGKEVFHAGDAGIGILFAGRGLGALFGPILARSFVKDEQRRLFIAIGIAMIVFGVGYSAFALMPVIWLAALMAMVAHLGGGAQWTMSTFGLQAMTPDHIRGRILAFDFGLVTLTMSTGFLVAGRAAERFNPRAVMAVLAAFGIVYAFVWLAWTSSLWRKGRVSAGPRPDSV